MKDTLLLKAEKRDILGKKVKKLRREGFIPANIYGRNIKSQAIQVRKDDFEKLFKEAGETQLINLDLGEDTKPVLVHKIQRDPVTDDIIHVDFLQVDLKQKVTASIPVVGIGESPAEKQGLGTVVFYIDEVEVEALPTDLPDKIEVDLSSLKEVDQAILIKDLTLDTSKVEVKANPEELVVKVEPIKEEVVEEKLVEEVPAEGEAEESQVQKEEPASPIQKDNNNS